jgi:hypothetical protein
MVDFARGSTQQTTCSVGVIALAEKHLHKFDACHVHPNTHESLELHEFLLISQPRHNQEWNGADAVLMPFSTWARDSCSRTGVIACNPLVGLCPAPFAFFVPVRIRHKTLSLISD